VSSDRSWEPLGREYCGDLRLYGACDPVAIKNLLESCRQEALRAPFPIDSEIYAQHGRNERAPILAAGNLAAAHCIFGRDLGKDEVRHAQPQIGAAGKLVRRGLLSAIGAQPSESDPQLEAALQRALLSNTVPFKPPGNKAYSSEVKERFRPQVAQLLGECWQGNRVITLGTEAFFWFTPYLERFQAQEFWKEADRYEREIECLLQWRTGEQARERKLVVTPLPHPSPLNRRWLAAFPGLLAKRLDAF
jgi:uracil-DNA glycosylase